MMVYCHGRLMAVTMVVVEMWPAPTVPCCTGCGKLLRWYVP